MAFKTGFVVMAPGGDPAKHRACIKTCKLQLTTVVMPIMDFDRAVILRRQANYRKCHNRQLFTP